MRILYLGNDLAQKTGYHNAFGTLKANFVLEGYDVISASSKKNQLLRLLDMIMKVIFFGKKVDYVIIDVFSTHAFYFAFITSQLSRLLNVKYISILHGGDLPKRLEQSPKLCKILFQNSYINVSPSAYLQTEFKKKGFESSLIPNTINIKNFDFSLRNHINPKLLYVRAFASIYNPVLAIDVLKELKKTHPTATLCMVGPDRDGTLVNVKNKITALGLESDVIITGVLSKSEWFALSKDYDVFMNTTNVDNTPVSLIEVMALGLPIVSTNVGGIPYLISDKKDGLLVSPDNVIEMTSAIELLLADSKISENLSKNGREKAELMDWEVVRNQWKKILV